MKALLLAALVAGSFLPGRAGAMDGDQTRQMREDYRIKARQDLDVIGDKIVALEMEARVEQKQARADLEARTVKLRAQKADAERLLGKLESSNEDERLSARARLDDLLRDMKKAIGDAEAAHRDWGSSRPTRPSGGLG